MNWELIDTREIDGFTIDTYVGPEDMEPDIDDGETLEQIRQGLLEWFQVKVTASKAGIELADTYLGGCCYFDPRSFIDDDYWADMAGAVMEEATKKIEELKE